MFEMVVIIEVKELVFNVVEDDIQLLGLFIFKYLDIYRSLKLEVVKYKWRMIKFQELFVFLFYYCGEWVSKEILFDKLWVDVILEKGLIYLYIFVYQI